MQIRPLVKEGRKNVFTQVNMVRFSWKITRNSLSFGGIDEPPLFRESLRELQ